MTPDDREGADRQIKKDAALQAEPVSDTADVQAASLKELALDAADAILARAAEVRAGQEAEAQETAKTNATIGRWLIVLTTVIIIFLAAHAVLSFVELRNQHRQDRRTGQILTTIVANTDPAAQARGQKVIGDAIASISCADRKSVADAVASALHAKVCLPPFEQPPK